MAFFIIRKLGQTAESDVMERGDVDGGEGGGAGWGERGRGGGGVDRLHPGLGVDIRLNLELQHTVKSTDVLLSSLCTGDQHYIP